MTYDIAISRTGERSLGPLGRGFSAEISIARADDQPMMLMSFKAKSASHAPSAPASTKRKPRRRLHGFFVQEEGEEARVAFVDKGQLIHYYLPLKLLKDAGVMVENQPFELDEFEAVVDGVPMKGYKVNAAARPQDSYPEQLSLNARSKENMQFLLAHSRNAAR